MLTSLFSFSEFHLNETLKTHDINLTVDDFISNFGEHSNLKISKGQKSTIDITISQVNSTSDFLSLLENINKLICNRHGWYPSSMDITNLHGTNMKSAWDLDYISHINATGVPRFKYFSDIKITYEAKYDISQDIPQNLYHLSIAQYKKDILNRGLIPKSKNKKSKHLDRIYVCIDPIHCSNLISDMKRSYYDKYAPDVIAKMDLRWIIWHIDCSKFKDFKLFKDPNYSEGFYIVENIPKDFIQIYAQEEG